ncbi:MAG: hypothetical protein CO073_00655 [Candidatus Komeilibacteria bacterium CG_4_9_14_0_8_um_filter_36_9]|uniref:Uncharacterized protein n=1 Tax=Candidatus Komeilibacteria bacterium CG_4_9_14_0_8_um_filter_36_9 TaxID=1974473 RepID=A0A2M8DS62_9BACT|nr:MAG: hypothetical protein CO073_00655 [Candidatus Komeilibacteria bacterium CG_4_9_14_0_8_um_filter_36_9]
MNFEQPPVKQEQNEKEPTKTDKILAMLDELPFAKGGRAGDMTNWNKSLEVLSQKDFGSLDEFVSAVRIELDSKQWIDENRPKKIMEYVEEMADLIKVWQEKE